jgi:hypothetical protein
MSLLTTIIIGLLGGAVGALVTPGLAPRLTPPVVRFFAGRSYRFMTVLVFAAAVMLLASVMIYAQVWQDSVISRAALFITGPFFVFYSVTAVWYARRIRQGTWKVLWVQALRALGREL